MPQPLLQAQAIWLREQIARDLDTQAKDEEKASKLARAKGTLPLADTRHVSAIVYHQLALGVRTDTGLQIIVEMVTKLLQAHLTLQP
jgi:hypothetical protein